MLNIVQLFDINKGARFSPLISRGLAEAGYAHVMAHHRGVHWVQAILKWLTDDDKTVERNVILPPK